MASVSRHVKLVCRSSTAMPGVNTNIGRSTKLLVSYEQPSYTRRGAVQRPTRQGGMSHLLRTNAKEEIDLLCLASRRDFIVSTDLRICDCK